jgi:protoporphyrinogen oxidase
MTDSSAGHQPRTVVIGAGPAGLTAAYELTKRDRRPIVVEADDVVGGISRTAERDGWRFDIGGHRFFTKVGAVEDLWHELLGPDELLTRPRLSRIFYDGKYFDYPLKASNALKNLGPIEALRCVLSYLWARIHPPKDQTTFEGWVAARFGWRLYNMFFKTYTEKVWGVPAEEIQADWAAQRIKDLSLFKAVVNAITPKRNQKDITSLIEEFEYPRLGPGQMWEACRDRVAEAGGEVEMQTAVTAIHHADGKATSVAVSGPHGERTIDADHVISSMPISALLASMVPAPPDPVLAAARGLAYRDFLTVALVVPESAGFPDNWIYVHSPLVRVGRIQNFGSWSPEMVQSGRTCLGLEFFCFEGDDLWTMADDDLIALGTREIGSLGLVDPAVVQQGYVVRMPKAYPMYDDTYRANVDVLRSWLDEHTPNVHPVGRNGMHKYNNQDHSMYTAMLTVENLVDGAEHDIWSVNVEEEYHEAKPGGASSSGTGRGAPEIPRQAFGPDHPVNTSR